MSLLLLLLTSAFIYQMAEGMGFLHPGVETTHFPALGPVPRCLLAEGPDAKVDALTAPTAAMDIELDAQ